MAKKVRQYGLMVIGGGTAGLRTALYAAYHGYKTVLIEPGVLGGTCLNTGCIPTKAMLHSSELFKLTKELKQFGIEAKGVKLNFPRLMARVHSIINQGRSHIAKSIKHPNLTLIRKKASFIDKNTVVAGQKKVSAKKIVISTGAKSVVFPIKGLDKVNYLLNDDVINLKKLPKSLIIVGGGYIAMEFATFFNELGCKVTILERLSTILSAMDDDVSALLTELYKKRGVKILTNVNILEFKKNRGSVRVIMNDVRKPKSKIRSISGEQIMLAMGRAPDTEGLNLEAAGIKQGKRGNIEINDYLKTSNPNVYAIGDVTGRAPFAHSAKRESHIALENALDNKKSKMSFDMVPWAVFTHPPVAGIGLSKKQAEEKGFRIRVLKARFIRAGRATIIGDTRGFVRVIVNKKNKKIIGCVIVGPNADDLIHEFVAIMNSSSPNLDTLRKTIHVHPTLSEVMEALTEVPVDG